MTFLLRATYLGAAVPFERSTHPTRAAAERARRRLLAELRRFPYDAVIELRKVPDEAHQARRGTREAGRATTPATAASAARSRLPAAKP